MKNVFLLLMLLVATVTNARPVDSGKAREIAEQFAMQKGKRLSASAMGAKAVRGTAANDTASTYIFNMGDNQGFVIIAGDDRTESVLGYSDQGSADAADLPDGLKYMLNLYEQSLKAMDAKGIKGVEYSTTAAREYDAVAPMVTSTWGQEGPYNLQCPLSGGIHCLTGCVPTAIGQLMRYHKWPASFNWSIMNDAYEMDATDAGAQEVARLMAALGKQAESQYGTAATSTYNSKGAEALVYFGFPSSKIVSSYEVDQEKLLHYELENGRPVLIGGTPVGGSEGGHMFICDGYDADGYFHINWGWRGYCDGYYRIGSLAPVYETEKGDMMQNAGIDYSHDLQMIVGIAKSAVTLPHYAYEAQAYDDSKIDVAFEEITAEEVTVNTYVPIKVTLTNNGGDYRGKLTLHVTKHEEDVATLVIGVDLKEGEAVTYCFDGKRTALGEYVYSAFVGEEEAATLNLKYVDGYLATALDIAANYGKATTVGNVTTVHVTVKNNGPVNYTYPVRLMVEGYRNHLAMREFYTSEPLDLAPGATTVVDFEVLDLDPNINHSLSAQKALWIEKSTDGEDYQYESIKFNDGTGIYTGYYYVINQELLAITGFECESGKTTKVKFAVKNNTGEAYERPFKVEAQISRGGRTMMVDYTVEDVVILPGETKVVEQDIEDFDSGVTSYAFLKYVGNYYINGKDIVDTYTYAYQNKSKYYWSFMWIDEAESVQDITLTEAGTLKSELERNMNTCRTLKVTGPINGDDFYNMLIMTVYYELRNIDLGDANIVDGGALFTTEKDVLKAGIFNAQANPNKLETFVCPKTLKMIDQQAFKGCQYLKKVTMPESLESVGHYAFDGNAVLEEIILPDDVKMIGANAFSNCPKLKKLYLGKSVGLDDEYVYYGVFENDNSLTEIELPTEVPPYCPYYTVGTFTDMSSCKLYVPMKSVEAYKADYVWGQFDVVGKNFGKLIGDADGSGDISMSDANMVVNAYLGNPVEGFDAEAADVDGDGNITMSDANAIVNMYLGN